METEMPCPEGNIHDYKLVGDAFICSKCSRVAPFKPVMSHVEALEKYHTLLIIFIFIGFYNLNFG